MNNIRNGRLIQVCLSTTKACLVVLGLKFPDGFHYYNHDDTCNSCSKRCACNSMFRVVCMLHRLEKERLDLHLECEDLLRGLEQAEKFRVFAYVPNIYV